MRRAAAPWSLCFALLGAGFGALAQDEPAPGETPATDGGEAGEPTEEGGEAEDLTTTAPANANPRPVLPVQNNELARNQLGEDLSLPPAGSSLGTGLRLRPWLVFQPSYRVSVFHDDNVFRQSFSNRDTDIEITNTFTGRLSATRERWDAAISYSAIFRDYIENSNLSSVDHLVQTSGGLRFNRVSFALNGSAGWSSRPTDPQFNGGQQRRFTSQALLTTTVTITQRVGVQVESQVQRIDFLNRRFDFFDQLGYGANGFVTFNPNLPVTFLAGGGYRELQYTNRDATAPDLALTGGLVGIGVATADQSLTFDLRLGYEVGRILKRRAFTRSAPEGVIVTAAGGWQPNPLTGFTLTFTRQITFSAQSSSLTLTRADLAVNRSLPLNTGVFLRVGWSLQENLDAADRRTVDLTLGGTWDPLPWLSVGAQTSYLSSRSRIFDYGVFRIGASLTLRL